FRAVSVSIGASRHDLGPDGGACAAALARIAHSLRQPRNGRAFEAIQAPIPVPAAPELPASSPGENRTRAATLADAAISESATIRSACGSEHRRRVRCDHRGYLHAGTLEEGPGGAEIASSPGVRKSWHPGPPTRRVPARSPDPVGPQWFEFH